MVNKQASGYSNEDIERFKSTTIQNNKEQQADQAAFYLFKP
jgi:hypothetical protein